MEFRIHVFKRFAYLLFALFVVNSFANYFYWYQSFRHFDKIMHFTGGVVASLLLIWVFYKKYLRFLEAKKLRKFIMVNTLLFLLIAVAWEVMEFSVQGIFGVDNLLATPLDSLEDLLLGTLGSLVGVTYFLNKVRSLKLIKNNGGN